MNIKTLLLSSVLAFSVTTVVPSETACTTQQAESMTPMGYLSQTMLPGFLTGFVASTSISYMAGKVIDIATNKAVIRTIENFLDTEAYYSNGKLSTLISFIRIAAQIGANQYWTQPLRQKLITVLNDYLGQAPELSSARRTSARLGDALGLISQFKAA